MDKASLVCECAVAANEWLSSNGCLESLDSEHVLDDLLCSLVNLGVDEGDVVVADNDVAKGRKALFDSLDSDTFGE